MRKILVVGPAWVGDMMMAQVLFQLLRHQNPTAEIHVLAPVWSEALLSRMPEVTKSIVLPFGHGQFQLRKRYLFAKQLRAEKYDRAFVLPNSFKSALIPFFAKIPKRTGFLGESRYGLLNDIYALDKEKLPKMIDRFAALAYPKKAILAANLPTPYLLLNQNTVDLSLKKQGLRKDQKILALCPGAEYGPSKCWPPDYYAAVASQKLKEGWAVWIFGSKNDCATAELIQAATEQKCINLTGKTNLSEAVDLLSLATAVVTNDSGLMHIACALNRKVIALYGSTSPDFTPPLSENALVLKLNLECQPCFERVCPLKHHHCMRELMPAQVLLEL
ncbi:MAG: lipopolysaccharide heptosyltransferase II [Coxiellaceae bacterium]|nr:lipopolysaccharide heptosyltransferase II [Coxiellaceae bacterium]